MSSTAKYTHPKILPFLCLTEMWERFGFYVAQGLLVLYVTEHFNLSDNATYTISGIFSALVYISPFVGGFLADRFIGFKTSIIWGGLFLIAGYALLAIATTLFGFYLGLSTIIIGNGLFKPNISSLLGTQYTAGNPKRDAGFTIFYIGINIGVVLSGLSGYVKDLYGWKATYSLASLGMLLGLATFIFGIRYLQPSSASKTISTRFKLQLLAGCVIAVFGVNILMHVHALTNLLLPVTGIALIVFLTITTLRQKAQDRKRLVILNALFLSSIAFWMLFLQLFNSANLYVSRLVEMNIFGIPLTPTIFWASESVFIFLLGPLFAWTWQVLGDHDKNPTPMSKFILGILFTSAGFCVLAYSTYFPSLQGKIAPLWIFASYLLLTIGELLISPVGLSAVTTLAPQRLVGMMMGVWFVATGFGGYFAGWIAKFASVPANIETTAQKLVIYEHAFFAYAGFALVVAIILFVLQLLVKNAHKH